MGPAQTNEWWVTLTHAFETHVREEARFLEAYEQLCKGIEDPGARFLIELILEDERRHHGIFERLAESARSDTASSSPPIPSPTREEAESILEPTKRFLEAEIEDRGHLRDLAKQLDGAGDNLWSLLIELMDLDTRKHVRILEYLRDRLEQAS
jgi:rubrerythrin